MAAFFPLKKGGEGGVRKKKCGKRTSDNFLGAGVLQPYPIKIASGKIPGPVQPDARGAGAAEKRTVGLAAGAVRVGTDEGVR